MEQGPGALQPWAVIVQYLVERGLLCPIQHPQLEELFGTWYLLFDNLTKCCRQTRNQRGASSSNEASNAQTSSSEEPPHESFDDTDRSCTCCFLFLLFMNSFEFLSDSGFWSGKSRKSAMELMSCSASSPSESPSSLCTAFSKFPRTDTRSSSNEWRAAITEGVVDLPAKRNDAIVFVSPGSMLFTMSLLHNVLKFAMCTTADSENRRPSKPFLVYTRTCKDKRRKSCSTTSLLVYPLYAYFTINPSVKRTPSSSRQVEMRRERSTLFSCTNAMLRTDAMPCKSETSFTLLVHLRTQSSIIPSVSLFVRGWINGS